MNSDEHTPVARPDYFALWTKSEEREKARRAADKANIAPVVARLKAEKTARLAARRKERARDTMRSKRGKDAATVRPYADLSTMTAEEIAARKRDQAREHKRRFKAKQKAAPTATPASDYSNHPLFGRF